MKKINIIGIILILIFFATIINAQEVTVMLKNGTVLSGKVFEENNKYIVLDYDLGQLKIFRSNIETISFKPSIQFDVDESYDDLNKALTDSSGEKYLLNDPVVIYLKNGSVVTGQLLAKSISMIMIKTDSGNLTIPKKDLQKIEYISLEYAERGEVVIVKLSNGQQFEGNIYFETKNDLTIDTELGRLTLPKNKLQTIEYTGEVGASSLSMAEQYTNLTSNQRVILPRYDVLSLGYSSDYGISFGPGFGFNYMGRHTLSQLEGLSLSGTYGVGLSYFLVNKDAITTTQPDLNPELSGGALITTISLGGQVNIFPQKSSFYDLYFAPSLEGNIVYEKLQQTYTSFPQFDSIESTTDFKFGVGLKFGVEFLFDSFRIGVDYNMHIIFSADGYQQLSVTFVKPLF